MHRSKIFAAFIAASLALPAFAYEPGSHAEISFQAALKSDLDRTLKDRFGLVFGRDEFANGRTVADWIAHGGAWEDMPPKRALNHFHQPLRPWGDAGIFGTGRSSIYWQQDQSGFVAFFLGGDDWGWKKARARLANLFLGATAGEREQALADVSRSLGHMMHLLQDAHSPPHTRNDEHLTKTDGYEHHIEEVRMTDPVRFFQLLNGPVVQPADDIFQPTGDSNAPSPVARLIDTDTFFGDAFTYSNGGNIGGAEYTNGGYLSDDTIFQDFAMPRRESLLPDGFLEQTGILRRKYFAKSGDGDSVLHFVAEGVLFEALRFRGFKDTGLVLDDKIYEDYAANLMPRAVGYSAALIDYFFREQLEIAAPDRHVYGRAAYEPSKPDIGFGKFTSLRFKVRNRSRDSMTSGKLTAVIRYRKLLTGGGEVDSLKNPDSPISIAVFQAKSKPVPAFALDDSFQEQLFDFSADPSRSTRSTSGWSSSGRARSAK